MYVFNILVNMCAYIYMVYRYMGVLIVLFETSYIIVSHSCIVVNSRDSTVSLRNHEWKFRAEFLVCETRVVIISEKHEVDNWNVC